MTICCVCQEETNKYKCPRCTEPYCSIACYKGHQETACDIKPSVITNNILSGQVEDQEPTLHQPFSTEDTVPMDKLQGLRNSQDLKNLLYNPHLRALLQQIDVAPNAWKAIRAAMQEPLFVEFADECLKVVEPPNEE